MMMEPLVEDEVYGFLTH